MQKVMDVLGISFMIIFCFFTFCIYGLLRLPFRVYEIFTKYFGNIYEIFMKYLCFLFLRFACLLFMFFFSFAV